MKTAVFAYSRRGCETARSIKEVLSEEECVLYTMEKYEEEGFLPLEKPSPAFYGRLFEEKDAMIFVGSCGIAVRSIAPHVKDKRKDPAVLCVDELGTYVIPLLSGHIGGANALAAGLSEKLSAIPVITTATDINHKFSVDAWAARAGYAISSMKAAKDVSAAILERAVGITSDFPVKSAYPPGTVPGGEGDIGILISCRKKAPYEETLRLIPPLLHLGIGCRRGTEESAIRNAVEAVLEEHQIDRRAIKCAASIDLKKDEKGLLSFCEKAGIPITFYDAETLRSVPGEFTASAFVSSVTGVDNVCERSALLGAEELLVKKTALNGVTVAVAAEKVEVNFG